MLSDDLLTLIAVDPEQHDDQAVQSVQNAEQLDTAELEQRISPAEYRRMKAEQQQW